MLPLAGPEEVRLNNNAASAVYAGRNFYHCGIVGIARVAVRTGVRAARLPMSLVSRDILADRLVQCVRRRRAGDRAMGALSSSPPAQRRCLRLPRIFSKHRFRMAPLPEKLASYLANSWRLLAQSGVLTLYDFWRPFTVGFLIQSGEPNVPG
jgi:hypothetical protein